MADKQSSDHWARPTPHPADSRCPNLSAQTETTEIKTTCLLPQYQSHNNGPNEDDLKEISDKSSKDDVQTTQRRLKQRDE